MSRRSQLGSAPATGGRIRDQEEGLLVSVTQSGARTAAITTTIATTSVTTGVTTGVTTSTTTTAMTGGATLTSTGTSTSTTTANHSLLRSLDADARISWVSRALCRTADPDELFVRGAAQRKAAVICRHCPVMLECGADALDNRVEFGVWGGMTERQRRALLKQHPEVTSWSEFFTGPRDHQHTGS